MKTGDRTLAAMWGRVGGLRLAATHDSHVYTAAGRRAFLDRFEREVDPELAPDERARRVEAARKAYFAELAVRSAIARRPASGPRHG
ncbi:MAG: hypothetical protein ACRDGL_05090 [Candidatus Limnocylindrales bacterium]